MNKCEAAAALLAWNMAINHKLSFPNDTTDILDLAHQYGKAISTPEHVDQASHLFNWPEIILLIESIK